MHFATMSAWLSPAKVSFVCSAHYLDHVEAVNLTTEQLALLKEIPDATFKESVRDFMTNQQFRRDYWIKGSRKLTTIEQAAQIKQHRLVLTSARDDISLKIAGALGEANLSEAIYGPVLDLMSDHKIRTVEEIALELTAIPYQKLAQSIIVLTGAGHLASVQTDDRISNAAPMAHKLNKELINKAQFTNEINYLASPVTGGAIEVNRVQQLFLLAIDKGKKHPQDWAQSAWTLFASQNQRLLKDGKAIETADGNLEELTRQAEQFASKRLPILKALHVL